MRNLLSIYVGGFLLLIWGISKEEIGLNEELVITVSFIISITFLYSMLRNDLNAMLDNKAAEQRLAIETNVKKGQIILLNFRVIGEIYKTSENLIENKNKKEITKISNRVISMTDSIKIQALNAVKSMLINLAEINIDMLNTSRIYNDDFIGYSENSNKSDSKIK